MPSSFPSSSPTSHPTSQPTCLISVSEIDPVDLGSACNYAILAKSGISTVPTSVITGNIGVSPIASGAITGFDLTLDSSTQFSTASQVIGKAFAADYSVPTPGNLTQAVSDMHTAYADAGARSNTDASRKNVEGGTIGGQILTPGVYTFTVGININSDITIEGGVDDIFIIQTTTTLTQAANTQVILSGCVQAKNIYWQVGTTASIGANASMQGILLVKMKIDFITGSSLVGSALSQKAVNLDKATITQAADTCTRTA
jgi:hypothetical protein